MARPKKKIDETLLEKLASIQCTLTEMASILECHPDTLRDRFSTIIAKGREHGKMSIRRKQMDVALSGNTTMLIWLGKQYLDQADKKEEDLHIPNQLSQALSLDERIKLALSVREAK